MTGRVEGRSRDPVSGLRESRIIASGVYLTRLPQGIELYFRPLRMPGAALSLSLFGLACLIPGLFAAIALTPVAMSGASGMVAIWLMSIFILPFVAFGVVFLALAAYRLANSLTITVTPSGIRSLRRVLGFVVRERRVARATIAALDAVTTRYRWIWNAAPLYGIVAMESARGNQSARRITVAEGLNGEELTERLRAEIASAAGLEHLLRARDSLR